MGERNTADQGLVLVERDARGVATVTLNDAKRFNALGQEMLRHCSRCWTLWPKMRSCGLWCWQAVVKRFVPGTI